MKDKIGTTDIKILVDRLDCGEKHGKDTDAMTKKWLISIKVYLDDVIRKKREMDGYYIHQDNRKAGYEIRLSDIKLIATSLNG